MTQTSILELVRPDAAHRSAAGSEPVLSPDQDAVVRLGTGSGPVLIWGAPGTGKSTVLVEAAVKRIEDDGVDPAGVLLLGPSRLAAARLRDGLSARLDRSLSTSPARTWASYAFDVLRRAKVEGRLPHLERAPKLLSGPEQDLIIKELLDGHRLGLGTAPTWPEDLREALGTRGFRQEVRQLFDRVIEYGLTPADLAGLGQENARPDWIAASVLYGEYRDVVDWGKSGSFDPAGIITAVIGLFEADAEYLDRERNRLQLILVDDIQEANQAVHRLLALLGRGKDVLITACPDTVVQGFRGARPDLAGQVRERLAGSGSVAEAVLSTSHRLCPELAQGWGRVAERISQSKGGHKARVLEATPVIAADQEDAAVTAHPGGAAVRAALTAHLVASEVHELRLIAERILDAQHHEGRRLADIAVIVRTGTQLAQLQRYLGGQGIDVKVPVAENAVRDEAAVQPLLDAFRVVLDPDLLDAELAVSLLTSRLGRSTSINLRRLRQALRRQERSGGGGKASDALLVEALLDPGAFSQLGWDGKNAERMSRMLAAGRKAAADPGANAETVLWALWDEAGCSDYWAAQAIAGGPAGIRADRDLDAIMALFQTAERYVDQLPGSSPRQFLEYLLNQELPMDTLAARAQRSDAVEILTPASAAGREWPVVIVAGLQEGIWPDTRLRGELLGSQLLVDVLERGPAAARQLGPATRLREIRYDELRSFSTAISRASERLICTAASSPDLQPSQFLDLVAPWEAPPAGPEPANPLQGRPVEQVRRPMTLRSLVAELRQESEAGAPATVLPAAVPAVAGQTGSARAQPAAEAARMLAVLAAAGAPGAAPDAWWGLAPLSSRAPIVPPDETVKVSPSKVEAVLKSPLNWFVQAAGGEAATDFARSLGTLVHSIAQEHPDAAGHEYLAELQRRWPALGMKENWEGKLDFKRAEEMVRKLAQYVVQMRTEGRSLLAVEKDFSVDLCAAADEAHLPGGAGPETEVHRAITLRGQVDRLEIDAEGNLVIIDLKTGRRKPKAAELAEHPQLGAYQAAVAAGAFAGLAGVSSATRTGGARLAQLGDGTKGLNVQEQEALNPRDDWATPLVRKAAGLMSGATFEAVHDPGSGSMNGSCPVPQICPLCSAGKQITE
ncbi:ATP-dependent helicase [Arthrobacter sp. H14-L1]|uniref:ATP-dependent helicase n=1 Tax=Arthrobacter sp. H14-L1 TaxID=2996697 RepID=UPI00226FFB9E|nr:ATP-dependent DNA helicase [Arthrobacter sp. H14-L1]MCY0903497.1 ATP-dependent DNA helicase [Arthrobacter sp. H14-L1]